MRRNGVFGKVVVSAIVFLACSNSGTSSNGNATISGGGLPNSGGFVSEVGSGGNGGTIASNGGASNGGSISRGGTTATRATGGNPTDTGGATHGTGGTTTGVAGSQTSSGGTTTGSGGTSTSPGGTAASAGGNTASTGGTTTSSGGAGGGTAGKGTTPGWGTPVTGGPTGTGVTATVTVNLSTTVGTIGPDFTGFSYEKTHVMNGSLTGNNTNLIALYKLLGSPSMRVGANDVETCTWAGTGTAPSQPNGQPFNTKITTGGVDQLCSFLAATGSKAIYGVNFRLNDVTASTAEVAYVMQKCPSSIDAFEIGNEPDKFGTWSSQQSQYESFATAILAVPGTVLAGPGVTSGAAASFGAPFAQSESAKLGSKLVLLTQHSYVAGATSADATTANLQIITTKLLNIFSTLNTAATTNKIPNGYRMGECNTFSGHGKQGLSDTLLSGLWAIDYMFTVASNGGSGVNFHGGETGMDGTTPYYYIPIRETYGIVVQVQPEYYGMLLFSQAGSGPMVSTTVSTSNAYFTAYAIKASGSTSVVLANKNASSGVNATVNFDAAVSSASAIYLQGTPAGSLAAPAGSVTLAGAQVTTAGVWNRNPPYIQTASGNTVSLYVPPASAALVRVLP